MRRLALPLAAGVLLALAGLVFVSLLLPSTASDAATLSTELRCPDCEGLSVAESPTRSAAEIRRQINALLADGATPDQVRQHFVDRYGEWILLAPRSPLPWLAPVALLALGVAGFGIWLRRRPGRADSPTPAAPGDAARRVADEAEALDA
jgi:cytochrome c-type biogenesis protein CcmH